MATAHISFGPAGLRASFGDGMPVLGSQPTSSEIITTSTASQQSAQAATIDGIVRLRCSAALYARTGVNPTVSATTGWYIPAGETTEIAISKGEKIALIDA